MSFLGRRPICCSRPGLRLPFPTTYSGAGWMAWWGARNPVIIATVLESLQEAFRLSTAPRHQCVRYINVIRQLSPHSIWFPHRHCLPASLPCTLFRPALISRNLETHPMPRQRTVIVPREDRLHVFVRPLTSRDDEACHRISQSSRDPPLSLQEASIPRESSWVAS